MTTTTNTKAIETKSERLDRLTGEANEAMRTMCWARGKKLESATRRYFSLLEQIKRIG